jgi:hypothetical protein
LPFALLPGLALLILALRILALRILALRILALLFAFGLANPFANWLVCQLACHQFSANFFASGQKLSRIDI